MCRHGRPPRTPFVLPLVRVPALKTALKKRSFRALAAERASLQTFARPCGSSRFFSGVSGVWTPSRSTPLCCAWSKSERSSVSESSTAASKKPPGAPTFDLSADDLERFESDHWLSNPRNVLVLRLEEPAWSEPAAPLPPAPLFPLCFLQRVSLA